MSVVETITQTECIHTGPKKSIKVKYEGKIKNVKVCADCIEFVKFSNLIEVVE